jgi:hypothetical protein
MAQPWMAAPSQSTLPDPAKSVRAAAAAAAVAAVDTVVVEVAAAAAAAAVDGIATEPRSEFSRGSVFRAPFFYSHASFRFGRTARSASKRQSRIELASGA